MPNGCEIRIYIENQNLIFENQCNPIPQKYLSHIFKPFYRLDFERDSDVEGNGLGLYIVDTVLQILQIPYTFTALDDNSGMRFKIDFT
ncbi:MAG: sensor histidine kinase [Oscillospiraceae bacterium]|nr:sensor histidine kinase [Oscillospiraceae bacterium]